MVVEAVWVGRADRRWGLSVTVAVTVSAKVEEVAVVVEWVGARGVVVEGRANLQGWRVRAAATAAVEGAESRTGTRVMVQCTFWRTAFQVRPPTI